MNTLELCKDAPERDLQRSVPITDTLLGEFPDIATPFADFDAAWEENLRGMLEQLHPSLYRIPNLPTHTCS